MENFTTSVSTEFFKVSNLEVIVFVEENSNNKLILSTPVPGINKENITVKFKKDTIEITIVGNKYIEDTSFVYCLGFIPNKEEISVYIKQGVLYIEVGIVESDVFNAHIVEK